MTPAVKSVACPPAPKGCGVKAGHGCKTTTGNSTAPHKARLDLVNRRVIAGPIEEVLVPKPRPVAEDTSPFFGEGLKARAREENISRVLFAINFGRRCMNLTQDQMDQRMAEIIVDHELDEFMIG